MLNIRPISLITTLMASIALSACQPSNEAHQNTSNNITQKKTYNVAMNPNFPPFESTSTNGSFVGFDVDIMNAIAREAKINIKYKNQPWDGIFQTLTSGNNDILISAITITPERKQKMAFSDPYFTVKQVVLLAPNQQHISSASDLTQLSKIGVTIGTTGDTAAQKIFGPLSPKIARFENLPLVIKELQEGGVQAIISDNAVVAQFIKQHGDQKFSVIEVPDFATEEYGIALRQSDTELLQRINSALKTIHDNGQYQQIYNQYFSNQAETESNKSQ